MIEKVYFDKLKNPEVFLPKYTELLQVESEVSDDLVYCFEDGNLALVTSEGMVIADESSCETLISLLKEEIADEVRLIIETYSIGLKGREKK